MGKLFSLGVAALALLSHSVTASPAKRQAPALKFNYGADKVRGVNLGGWFVLEPWITPSLFQPYPAEVVDEWTLTQYLGPSSASQLLQNHWATWITQADFNSIAAAGLNHVRIPIGYWSVAPIQGDPYVQGAYDYLARSLDWAQAAGLKVLIDLHGAPGSQNGFDNSGRKGSIAWTQGATIDQTKAALNKIRDDHAAHPAVAAIELVNEPMGPQLSLDTIRQFYYDGWGNLRDTNTAIVFHDAFMGVNYWDSFGAGLYNLIEDTHHYEVFDQGQLGLSPAGHVQAVCQFGAQMASSPKWVVCGEFTGAQTDCALWLNGRNVGARYDGTYNVGGTGSSYIGSCAGKSQGRAADLSAADKQNIRQLTEAQLDAYETAAGWIWWTWKTEGAPEWDMQDLIANGLFPQPIDSRQFPGQCGYS